ncbi:SDR family oxidoreductase [Marivibrio halodurans]|uniref:SDR family oxidoreductase n=1 Tax=Marivibrio halodurans TaxID=2039722 RepID=A0A8J7V3H7_9PROT|nr:SDR family NAD(P)-dependent oxidoreductase [Marivibrio halodurans]MBP5856849.1 SDR family oxidoreductase [Marivibrio halodurans]
MKKIIVTGAASGIGHACVLALRATGRRIAALDIAVDALDELYRGDEGVSIHRLDAGSTESCRESIDEAVAELGGLDTLIHCAAIWSGTKWEESEKDEWDAILSVNLTGTFFLAKAAASHMRRGGGGGIVLTASDSARVGGVAGGPAYASSKGGVIALTRSLARALGPDGIRVNAVNPGVVDTPMTRSWPRAIIEQTIERTPLGRIARSDDVADVACFLASDKARFVSGEVLEVNGGFYFD